MVISDTKENGIKRLIKHMEDYLSENEKSSFISNTHNWYYPLIEEYNEFDQEDFIRMKVKGFEKELLLNEPFIFMVQNDFCFFNGGGD